MELLLAGIAMYFITKGRGASDTPADGDGGISPQSQAGPPKGAVGDQSPNAPAPDLSSILGATTATIGVVGSVLGVLKGAGIIGGVGAGVGVGTGTGLGTGAGVGTGIGVGTGTGSGAGTAAGGTSAAVAAGGTSGLAVLGQAAIVVAIAVAVFLLVFSAVTGGQRGERWLRWTERDTRRRYGVALFLEEQDFLESAVDPQGIEGGTTKQVEKPFSDEPPVLVTNYTRSRRYVTYLEYWNASVHTNVPDEVDLPEAQMLLLTRVARWSAMTQVRAYNAAQRSFWGYMGYPPNGLGQAGLSDADLEEFYAFICREEPYAKELGRRCATDVAGLQAAADYMFGPNIEQVRRLSANLGAARALKDAAVQGYSFGWPGDEEFCRELVRRSGLGTGEARGNNPTGWYVEIFNVNGSLRWVAVDSLTQIGVDIVLSREREALVRYVPEQLHLGKLPNLLPYTPATSQAADRLVAPPPPPPPPPAPEPPPTSGTAGTLATTSTTSTALAGTTLSRTTFQRF
jgi:hypothetical protein